MSMLINRLDEIDNNNRENQRKAKANEDKAAASQKEFQEFLKGMKADADTERKEAAKRAEKHDENNVKLQNLMASDKLDLKNSIDSLGARIKMIEASNTTTTDAESPSKRGKCDA